MITTKNTYMYRVIGVVGAALILLGVFLPWVTIDAGKLESFDTGAAPSGWQLVNLPKDFSANMNIIAFLFVFVYILIIGSIIAMIMIGIGSDGQPSTGMALFLIIFYLLIALFLLPMVQSAIPVPSDPYEGVTDEDLAIMREQMSAEEYQARIDEMNMMKAKHDQVMEMKEVRFGLQYGLILCLIGSITGYAGARLVNSDTAKRINLEKYRMLLVEAHKDGRITKEVADLLGQQRRMFGISKDDHEYVLLDIFPDPKEHQIAVQQHLHPLDMDRIIMEKRLQEYEIFLIQAYRKGEPTREEAEMLFTIRRTQGISVEDHNMVLNILIQDGRIPHPDDVRRRREAKARAKAMEKARKEAPAVDEDVEVEEMEGMEEDVTPPMPARGAKGKAAGRKALSPEDVEKKGKSLHDMDPDTVQRINWEQDYSNIPRRLPSAGPPRPANYRPPTQKVQAGMAVATPRPPAPPVQPMQQQPRPYVQPTAVAARPPQAPVMVAAPARPQAAPPPDKGMRFKCPKCGNVFMVSVKRPATIVCPKCGTKGQLG